MLQVPIIVVTHSHEGIEFREEAHTLVVNAHGGLMKLHMEVVAGQPLVLTNPKTGVQEKCRVIRVENPPGGQSAVAFEFDRPAPQFWPIVFPPPDWDLPKP